MTKARLRRWLRLAKALTREKRLPRPVRWLLIFGVLPIPLALDEIALLLALGIIVIFYRDILRGLIESTSREEAPTWDRSSAS